jgi:shikimate dehydrogenase
MARAGAPAVDQRDGDETPERIVRPGGAPVLVGLIGSGIQASRTPAMHEREGEALGLRYVYLLLDLDRIGMKPDQIGALITAGRNFGFAGFNVTHPCKQIVLPMLDGLSPDAAAIGAVNTIVIRDGRTIGYNTDCSGFAESFRREMGGVRQELVLQLGAGGAGAAVAHALLGLGVSRLAIYDTEPARARALAGQLCERFGAGRAEAAASPQEAISADGIVNTTPVGMAKYPGLPLDAALLRPGHWVADIIYFPEETELLRRARALGCRTMSGAGMALFQAVDAFRLFTSIEPHPDRMRRHFESA